MGIDCSQYTHWACVHWPLRLLETSKQNIPEINLAYVEMVLGMKGTSVSQVTVVCEALHWGLERVCVCVFWRWGTGGSKRPVKFPLLASMNLSITLGTTSSTLSHSPDPLLLLPDCEPGKSSNCSVLPFPCL